MDQTPPDPSDPATHDHGSDHGSDALHQEPEPPHTIVIRQNWHGQVIFDSPEVGRYVYVDGEGRLVVTSQWTSARPDARPDARPEPGPDAGPAAPEAVAEAREARDARFAALGVSPKEPALYHALRFMLDQMRVTEQHAQAERLVQVLARRGWSVVDVSERTQMIWLRYAGTRHEVLVSIDACSLLCDIALDQRAALIIDGIPLDGVTATCEQIAVPYCDHDPVRSFAHWNTTLGAVTRLEVWASQQQ